MSKYRVGEKSKNDNRVDSFIWHLGVAWFYFSGGKVLGGDTSRLNFEILTSKQRWSTLKRQAFNLINNIFFFLDCTLPFRVGIHTDGVMDAAPAANEDADAGFLQSRGVCLDYKQI